MTTKWGVFNMRPGQDEIHVAPEDPGRPLRTQHILLALVCFCNPFRDPEDSTIIVHREPSEIWPRS